jgi:hypothetical protein
MAWRQHPHLDLPRRGDVSEAIPHDAHSWNAPLVRLGAVTTRFRKQGGWGHVGRAVEDVRDEDLKKKILDWRRRRRHRPHSQHGLPGNSDGEFGLSGGCGDAAERRW